MSKKSSKLDLLVRVRFENPVPDPPFPPKLLNVKTDIQRLGDPSYLDQLASSAPLPMLLDAEMGMPIDLNEFEGVWDGDDSAINPVSDPSRVTDPADFELLTPLRIIPANGAAGTPGTSTPLGKPEVSWMRNTTYMAKKDGTVPRRQKVEKRAVDEDDSTAARILAIEQTFTDVRAQPLEEMRHPDTRRKNLTVVESYDILPDDDAWSNSYILIKFPDRPSVASAANPGAVATRPRLERAVLRPVMEDGDQIMEYFLPQEDDLGRLNTLESEPLDHEDMDKLRAFAEENRAEKGENIDDVFPNVAYERIRTYEVVDQLKPEKEFLLTFTEEPNEDDDEENMFGDEEPAKKKRKGAYYKDITMLTTLRKTRARRSGEQEGRADMWDKVRVAFREAYGEENDDRDSRAKVVTDPLWTDEQLNNPAPLAGAERGAQDYSDEDE